MYKTAEVLHKLSTDTHACIFVPDSSWQIWSATLCSGTVWIANGCWWRAWSITSYLSTGPHCRVHALGPAKQRLEHCLLWGGWMLPKVETTFSHLCLCCGIRLNQSFLVYISKWQLITVTHSLDLNWTKVLSSWYYNKQAQWAMKISCP